MQKLIISTCAALLLCGVFFGALYAQSTTDPSIISQQISYTRIDALRTTVDNGTISATQAYSYPSRVDSYEPWPTAWETASMDLTPWRDSTITVTFAYTGGHYQLMERGWRIFPVFIDNVSVGSWRTALVSDITPSQFSAGIAAHVTITADNLMDTPRVSLGPIAATKVVRSSDNTLEVDFPPIEVAGIYALLVTNPDGLTSPAPKMIIVGNPMFLPIAPRDGG